MGTSLALSDRVSNGMRSQVHPCLNQASLLCRQLRSMLAITVCWLAACDPLWTQFREPNPINCLATPGICSEGQVCNSQTRSCSVPTLSLLAGRLGGPSSIDSVGAAARFTWPESIATDGIDSLYVADTGNSTVRKVVLSTGVVTTIAGSAGMGGSTDGVGSIARFLVPSGVATDGAGNLYVADRGNSTIRKVVLGTGAVTTIAGAADARGSADGTGTAARFFGANGLAADGLGNLYVADTSNGTIRKIVLRTGAVTTIAGMAGKFGSTDGNGTAARFVQPNSVATDGTGNLYVADTGNSTIRKLALATGEVTTIAGTAGMRGSVDGTGASARFSMPYSLAVDRTGNIYVADISDGTIRKIEPTNAMVTTVAGTANQWGVKLGMLPGQLRAPAGVAILPTGEMFIADNWENTILAIR